MGDDPAMMRRIGLVLAGGGARGAYEVGVVHYLVHDIARELGREFPLDVLCGTSAGAINVCGLAALADEPRRRADRLAKTWRSLEIQHVLRPDADELIGMGLSLFGVRARGFGKHGGLINPDGIRRVVSEAIPFDRISSQIEAGRVSALSVSTTHVGSGRTVVFVQRENGTVTSWGDDTTVEPCDARIGLEHALASAAIPFLFPAIPLDGHLYCDGALRQNVPLSPARRLGSDALIIVNPHRGNEPTPPALDSERERAFAGPAFLLGKTLNSLLLDRIDSDVERLQSINRILEAGTHEYGPDFIDALNRRLGKRELSRLRPLESIVIRPSENIGVIASELLRSREFLKGRSIGGRVFRRLVDAAGEADLASFILFDGKFADRLFELGRNDARAEHDRLAALGDEMLRSRGLSKTAA